MSYLIRELDLKHLFKSLKARNVKDVASCALMSTPRTHWCQCNGGSGREPLRGSLVTGERMVRQEPRNYRGQRNREVFEGARGRELVEETGSCRSTCSNQLLRRCELPLGVDETGTWTAEGEHPLGGRTGPSEGSGGEATEVMAPGILPTLTEAIGLMRGHLPNYS